MGSSGRPLYVTPRSARRLSWLPRGGGRLWLVALATAAGYFALSAGAHAAVGEVSMAGDAAGSPGVAVAPTPTRAVDVLTAALPDTKSLVSRQYHAKNADTEAIAGPNGPAADPTGGDSLRAAASSDPETQNPWLLHVVPRSKQASPTNAHGEAGSQNGWYRHRNSQYQLHETNSQALPYHVGVNMQTIVGYTPTDPYLSRGWIRRSIATSIGYQTPRSSDQTVISAGDARRLLQLGVGLAFAYLVFLVCWFWKTRDRPHGVGRVVRF